jgi:hypothetical protein
MTPDRYRHYQAFNALLASLDEVELPEEPRRLLADLAEDMLLSRTGDRNELLDTRLAVELTVSELAAIGTLSPRLAEQLTRRLLAAGPPLRERPLAATSSPA